MDTLSAHHAPTLRTVDLRAALAIGAVAVAGAFGTGYMLAQQLDEPARVAVAASPAAHTFGDARAESLALKQAPLVQGRAGDIRMRRIR
jgi:hypothetical protein